MDGFCDLFNIYCDDVLDDEEEQEEALCPNDHKCEDCEYRSEFAED